MTSYKAKKRMQNGLWEKLFVDQSRKGLFRIYATVGGRRRVYKPANESFLMKEFAQQYLDNYALEKHLEVLSKAVLDSEHMV